MIALGDVEKRNIAGCKECQGMYQKKIDQLEAESASCIDILNTYCREWGVKEGKEIRPLINALMDRLGTLSVRSTT
jgi:predicted metal-binding protein